MMTKLLASDFQAALSMVRASKSTAIEKNGYTLEDIGVLGRNRNYMIKRMTKSVTIKVFVSSNSDIIP